MTIGKKTSRNLRCKKYTPLIIIFFFWNLVEQIYLELFFFVNDRWCLPSTHLCRRVAWMQNKDRLWSAPSRSWNRWISLFQKIQMRPLSTSIVHTHYLTRRYTALLDKEHHGGTKRQSQKSSLHDFERETAGKNFVGGKEGFAVPSPTPTRSPAWCSFHPFQSCNDDFRLGFRVYFENWTGKLTRRCRRNKKGGNEWSQRSLVPQNF